MDRNRPGPGAALLLIDVINDLDSDQIDDLPHHAAQVPTIYVNDNFGDWHRDPHAIVEHCAARGGAAGRIVERLRPRSCDLFVVKPQFSGFYATNLPVILPQLGVTRLILAGLAADICVLFTAADAHMREYGLWVPGDVVASTSEEHRDWALGIMAKSMAAEVRPTGELALAEWLEAEAGEEEPARAETQDEAVVH